MAGSRVEPGQCDPRRVSERLTEDISRCLRRWPAEKTWGVALPRGLRRGFVPRILITTGGSLIPRVFAVTSAAWRGPDVAQHRRQPVRGLTPPKPGLEYLM